MIFQPGQSGNPAGRPKGAVCGRVRAVQLLDEIIAEPENQQRLRDALREEFEKNPQRFFRTIIMPLLPKESLVAIQKQEPQVVKWTSLLDTYKMRSEAAAGEAPAAQ